MRPPCYYGHFILVRTKAQSVIFVCKNPYIHHPSPTIFRPDFCGPLVNGSTVFHRMMTSGFAGEFTTGWLATCFAFVPRSRAILWMRFSTSPSPLCRNTFRCLLTYKGPMHFSEQSVIAHHYWHHLIICFGFFFNGSRQLRVCSPIITLPPASWDS